MGRYSKTPEFATIFRISNSSPPLRLALREQVHLVLSYPVGGAGQILRFVLERNLEIRKNNQEKNLQIVKFCERI
jgi:hypothetical protein